jgi:hypothetical protein
MSRKEGQDDWRSASLPAISDQAEMISIDEVPNSWLIALSGEKSTLGFLVIPWKDAS